MKKLLNYSMIYFILGIVSGVFYREFTKYMGFSGKTALAVTHTHFLILGTFLFLILALFSMKTDLQEIPKFKTFMVLYNTGLPLLVIMLWVRGIVQILGLQLGKGADAAISGVAGISHILVTVAFIILFSALKKMKYERLSE